MVDLTLNDRYRLDAELGRGGMGVVYRAHDMLLGRDVAIKVLSKVALGTESRARLLREAQAAAQLNHPNIVSVYDAGEADGAHFIVMEMVEGSSLYERLPIGLDEAIIIARQVCAALEHAHAHGIVHRDLKPENVIIADDDTVKLTDFGLARSMASRVSTEGTISGTVFYLPPEQALGQEIDGRTDLYALGVVMYELTTGRLPFTADDSLAVISQHLHAPVVPPRTYNVEIPPMLDALIVQMMSKRPEERPASATEVRRALEELASRPVLSQPAEPSPLEQLACGRLVGREVEFAEARALWKQALTASGEKRVLLISGEPGVGKTPLVREIRSLVEVSRGRALTGTCYAEGNAPYAPIAQITQEALPLLQVGLPDLVLASLMALAPDLQAQYPEVPPNPPLGPQADQQRLFESVVVLCGALADRTPLLLVVEDVQWADGGTLFLLRHLARRSRSAQLKLMIVLTYREAEVGEACCLNDVLLDLDRMQLATRIKLTRLSQEQARVLLAVMLQEEIPDEFLDGIYRETEGNPFFIEEMCKALIEDGALYREDGRWHWPGMDQVRLPQSVKMVIQSRVGRLPAQAQDVLRLAAIIGREFDFETLLTASELDEDALVDALEAAERAQLITEASTPGKGRETFAFAHKLTMTTLRESVSGLRRRRLHHRVADAIKTLHPDDGSRLEALAYHYEKAGDEENALTYVLRAADRAHSLYANDDAIRLYTEALHLMPEGHPDCFDVLAARAGVYDVVARREEQLADVEEMLALADTMGDDARRCDALIALTDYYLETEPAKAEATGGRAVALAQALGDPVRQGHALRCLGREARYRYDFAVSRSALEEATAHFREANRSAEAALCLHMLSLTLSEQGETDAALQAAQDALAASRAAGDRRQEAISLRRLAIVYLGLRQHATALPFAEAALALHQKLGDRSEECRALNVLGVISGWLGRLEEARQYLLQSLDLARAIDSSQSVRAAVINMLWAYYERVGEYEAALAFLQEEMNRADRTEDTVLVAHLRSQQPFLLAALGQYGLALDAVQGLMPVVQELLGAANHSRFLTFVGRMEAELGHPERARDSLQAAQIMAEQGGMAVEIGIALHSLALVALREGGVDILCAGLERVRQAIDLLRTTTAVDEVAASLHLAAELHLAVSHEALPAEEVVAHRDAALACSTEMLELTAAWPVARGEYLYTHACALRAVGRDAEADDHLQRAYERVMLIASKTHQESLRRGWLENVRINREILAEWAAKGTKQ